MTYTEKTTKSDRIYEGKIVNLRIDTVELPNMNYAHREIIEHKNSVCIIPFKDENTVYMVKTYRKAVDKVLLEFPAGLIEDDEEPREAALRELQEEIGFASSNFEFLTEIYPSPGYTDEKIKIFIAKDLYKLKLEGDADEFLDIVQVSLDKLEDLVASLDLQDAKSMLGALHILGTRR